MGIASAHLYEHAVGLLGVGVLPAERRKGVASALSVIAARTFAADLVWLHASEMGRMLYARLGFRRIADWEVWTRPDPR